MKNKNKFIKPELFIACLVVGVWIGVKIWEHIRLPFSNPYGVIGVLNDNQYSPLNNIVGFSILALMPVILLAMAHLFLLKRFRYNVFVEETCNIEFSQQPDFVLKKSLKILLYTVLLLFAGSSMLEQSHGGTMDTFHEGETLGPAICYREGQVPYRDTIFLHGLYQDPLRTLLAFHLFGTSIESMRHLEIFHLMASAMLLTVIILMIFKNRKLSAIVTTFIFFIVLVVSAYKSHFPFKAYISSFLPGGHIFPPLEIAVIRGRDIPVFLFIILFIVLHQLVKQDGKKKSVLIVNTLLSAMPIFSLIYSIDVGFYVLFAYFLLFPFVYWMYVRHKQYEKTILFTVVLGWGGAFLLLGTLLRWDYVSFVDYVFLKIPAYKELMDGLPFPRDYRSIFYCTLMAANLIWLCFRFCREYYKNNQEIRRAVKGLFDNHFVSVLLLVISVAFFRSALGRFDIYHEKYVATPLFLLFFYNVCFSFDFSVKRSVYYRFLIGSVAVLAIISGVNLFRSFQREGFFYRLVCRTSDHQLIPSEYHQAIEFLSKNLKATETFVTLSSEASWYYFVNKSCPVRFPVIWFAATNDFQREFIKQIENQSNIKYIIYKTPVDYIGTYFDSGFGIEKRCPLVFEYINKDFVPHVTFNGIDIWIRKDYIRDLFGPQGQKNTRKVSGRL